MLSPKAVCEPPRSSVAVQPEGLDAAANRLKQSDAPQKVLQVPQKDMAAAAVAMRKAGVGGTVKNMGGTKRRSVRSPKQ